MKIDSLPNKLINDFKNNSYTYKTNQSIDELRDKIEFVINQREVINSRYNLTGKLNSDNSFNLVRRVGLIIIDGGTGGPPVRIKGKLIEIGNSKTNIEIELKPNWVLVIMPIIFGTIAILLMANSIITENKENILGGFFLIAIPIFWAMIKFSKKYYKSEFEKALDLTNSEIIEQE